MNRNEFLADTAEMYRDLAAGVYDCPENFTVAEPILRALAEGDMPEIRQAFKNGFVGMMCPFLMESLDKVVAPDEIEIRITHKNKTIGVIIDSEVVY